jgi:hypothetical protein
MVVAMQMWNQLGIQQGVLNLFYPKLKSSLTDYFFFYLLQPNVTSLV